MPDRTISTTPAGTGSASVGAGGPSASPRPIGDGPQTTQPITDGPQTTQPITNGPQTTQPSTDPALPRDRHQALIDLPQALDRLEGAEPLERLRWAHDTFGEAFALTTSFGIQSAVMLHLTSQVSRAIPVIWVDTGYLHPETYRYAAELTERFGLNLQVAQAGLSPARMEALHGRLWETGSVDDLTTYHRIRKVEPLEAAMERLGVGCWASGVRGGQTDHRRGMALLDGVRGRWSLRPLLNWTQRDVYYYMERHGLPQHPLFAQGYSTVGDHHSSAPDDGQASGRSTRFGGLKQECGIHLSGEMGEGI